MGYRPRIDIVSGATEEAIGELSRYLKGLGPLDPDRPYSVCSLRPDYEDSDRWEISAGVLSEAVFGKLHSLFLRLCRSTDWELLLDWEEAPADTREYLYRARGGSNPVVLDLDDPESPLYTV